MKRYLQCIRPVVVVANREIAELIDDFPRAPAAGIEAEAVLGERWAEATDAEELVVGVVD